MKPPATSQSVESAPAADQAAAPVATAPAPAAVASEGGQKPPGFLARLIGSADRVVALETELSALQGTHAATLIELGDVKAKLETLEAMEQRLEAAQAATVTAQAETATAQAAAATLPQQVAAAVVDAVATLGVEAAALPAVETAPPAAGQGGEFSGLKGRERAAAAINAQFEAKQ